MISVVNADCSENLRQTYLAMLWLYSWKHRLLFSACHKREIVYNFFLRIFPCSILIRFLRMWTIYRHPFERIKVDTILVQFCSKLANTICSVTTIQIFGISCKPICRVMACYGLIKRQPFEPYGVSFLKNLVSSIP